MQNSAVRVRIRGLAYGGSGVGPVESTAEEFEENEGLLGITSFVPYTAPGEVVEINVLERKPNHLQGELLKVIEVSPNRVSPPCEYFTSCGGCELQHLSYEEQLRAKKQMLFGALRAAKFSQHQLDKLGDIVASPSPLYYRARVNLHLDKQQSTVGFYRPGSRSLVEVNRCEVALPAISKVVGILNSEKFKKSMPQLSKYVGSVSVEADETGEVIILRAVGSLSEPERKNILQVFKNFFESVSIFERENEVAGFGRRVLKFESNLQLGARSKHVELHYPAGSFSQVNPEVNKLLIEKIAELTSKIKPLEGEENLEILELYAGAGNFAISLASMGHRVKAVELDEKLVRFGKENARANKVEKKLSFEQSSTEKFLKDFETRNGRPKAFDLILADPPRQGIYGVINKLPTARYLILVSCDMASFVRDLRNLTELGYSVEEILAFDMFCQTSYLEIVALLSNHS